MNHTEHTQSDDIALFEAQYATLMEGDVHARLPGALRESYTVVSCISVSEKSETYEVVGKRDNVKYILKVIQSADASLSYEDDVLRALDHPAIPKLIESVHAGGKRYVVRQFFIGYPLSQPLNFGRTFKRSETIELARKLCDILQYLHSRPVPIVYRDIKPQNIVITPEGDVKLVDFDIARLYDTASGTDTVYYGTREYSPPEQFGYCQTDARTDVYAVGVLMTHMLTGSPDIGGIPQLENRAMRALLTRCTQFAPKDRFPDIRSLQKALDRQSKARRFFPVRFLRNALIAAACIAVGFFAGSYAERRSASPEIVAYSSGSIVEFQSSLIDAAVRAELGRPADEPIYFSELASVESLQIWGDAVYSEETEDLVLGYDSGFSNATVYWGGYSGKSEPLERGGITSLEEIALLGNLKKLDVVMQQITDLSPLANLPLTELNLAGNRIADLSPLSQIETLTRLNIDYNPVTDLSPLGALYYLEDLNASDTLVEDVSPLKDLCYLKYLYINDAKISDVSALEGIKYINLYLKNNAIADVTPLTAENLHVEGNPGSN